VLPPNPRLIKAQNPALPIKTKKLGKQHRIHLARQAHNLPNAIKLHALGFI